MTNMSKLTCERSIKPILTTTPGTRPCWSSQINQQTSRLPNIGRTLAHRLPRWPNIKPALGERHVFPVSPALSYI